MPFLAQLADKELHRILKKIIGSSVQNTTGSGFQIIVVSIINVGSLETKLST